MAEDTLINTRIRSILTDLANVRENLLALSDDIWLSIDHNDPDALDAGYAFKKDYILKMQEFDNLSTGISELIQDYTKVSIESKDNALSGSESENQRIIKELDKEEPHSLNEDFSFKRPFGFIMPGYAIKDIVTWKQLYMAVCDQLNKRDQDRFNKLPINPKFISTQKNPYFALEKDKLRAASPVTDTIFAETNLSANMIKDSIKRLLTEFSIDPMEMRIYLRQDRNALDG